MTSSCTAAVILWEKYRIVWIHVRWKHRRVQTRAWSARVEMVVLTPSVILAVSNTVWMHWSLFILMGLSDLDKGDCLYIWPHNNHRLSPTILPGSNYKGGEEQSPGPWTRGICNSAPNAIDQMTWNFACRGLLWVSIEFWSSQGHPDFAPP